jgi:uncharacterized protein YhdP
MHGMRVALFAAGGAVTLAAVVLIAYALAVARVPQHRAALEELLRAETGLNVRFGELGVRWGWYGPEAVFQRVELGEPQRTGTLLTARELVVGFDLWRMLRSGAPEAGRITLRDPDIDLAQAPLAASPQRGAPAQPAAPGAALSTAGRVLAHWRGTRLDIEGGTVRAPDPAGTGAPLAMGIQRVALRRVAAGWSGEAELLLPQRLGGATHLALTLQGDHGQPADLSGALRVEAERLRLAGWNTLLSRQPGAAWLPRAGTGAVTLQLQFARGVLTQADGSVQAEALQWPEGLGSAPAGALGQLRGAWHLARRGALWHLEVERLELGTDATSAALMIDADARGAWARGRIERLPVAALAAVARGLAPELPLTALEFGGRARALTFDWDRGRAPGERLHAAAELEAVTIAPRDGATVLAGVEAHLLADGRRASVVLHAEDARVTLVGQPGTSLVGLVLGARLTLEDGAQGWRLATRDLEIRHHDARLTFSGELTGLARGEHPWVDAHARLTGADVALLHQLLPESTLGSLGLAGELTAGRIEEAQLSARGRPDEGLPWSAAGAHLSGSLSLSDARLAGGEDWPEVHHIDARVVFRAARVQVHIARAAAGTFQLAAASGEWDARAARLVHLSGRVSGDAQEALAWLRDHPQLQRYAPLAQNIDLRGETLLDFDLRSAGGPGANGEPPRLHSRLTAVLDGVRLRPMAGLPAIDALRGTLAFADGHLQRSTLSGAWLGGPISLGVGEHRLHGATALVISGRGLLSVRQALLASTGVSDAANPLQGNADWSAELRLVPGADRERTAWRVRADSGLVGVTSGLPDPFAKPARSALALHLELAGRGDEGRLRLALGDRLRGVAAVERHGELWQIERGAVSLGATAPPLPAEPVVLVQGAVSRLDLPAYALLWRQLTHSPAWPALRARITAAELLAAGRTYPDVTVSADSGPGLDELRLESAALTAEVRWPVGTGGRAFASAHFSRLDLPALDDPAAGLLLAALGPATQLSVEELELGGRPLGALTTTIMTHGRTLDAGDVSLEGTSAAAHAAVHCQDGLCHARFTLDSHDAAATLASLGLRPDLRASRAQASGDLQWSPAADRPALATLEGHLHIEFDDGIAKSDAAPEAPPAGEPLGLIAVPALIAATGSTQLRFTRLAAGFELHEGQAVTSDLHFDGDAEILLRGRIGLLAQDYDAQVWVLRGEQRLPAAVRGFGPTPRMAALWLSLRELFGGPQADRRDGALHLHGSWDDPVVSAAD